MNYSNNSYYYSLLESIIDIFNEINEENYYFNESFYYNDDLYYFNNFLEDLTLNDIDNLLMITENIILTEGNKINKQKKRAYYLELTKNYKNPDEQYRLHNIRQSEKENDSNPYEISIGDQYKKGKIMREIKQGKKLEELTGYDAKTGLVNGHKIDVNNRKIDGMNDRSLRYGANIKTKEDQDNGQERTYHRDSKTGEYSANPVYEGSMQRAEAGEKAIKSMQNASKLQKLLWKIRPKKRNEEFLKRKKENFKNDTNYDRKERLMLAYNTQAMRDQSQISNKSTSSISKQEAQHLKDDISIFSNKNKIERDLALKKKVDKLKKTLNTPINKENAIKLKNKIRDKLKKK